MIATTHILKLSSAAEWRNWLSKHHESTATVWVAVSRKNAPTFTLSQNEAVLEALCYGWIDGTARPLNEHYFLQSFSRRKPKSVWSKINKERVKQFIKDGRMAQPGLDSITVAKSNGYWSILDDVEALIIPTDLATELKKDKATAAYFEGLARSNKKQLLQLIVLAQRPETRAKRLLEVVTAAQQGQKPARFS
ncbi:YdeI family protein [uncultured Chitinophaga sp.]|uniref:YdeI/OmpD-associated family protein n=1 Tax=uncultured Chitinophaga sp. TaxID=339340 RepID=UPI0025FDFC0D|nr:YdeI/OmpD-associated family protein [uncultured Chitinophaga sp.]